MFGHNVICIAPQIAPKIREELCALGATVYEAPLRRTGLNLVSTVRISLALHRLFRRIRPDIVMADTAKPTIYDSIAAKTTRVPRIFPMLTGLGRLYLPSKNFKTKIFWPIMNMRYRIAFAGSDGILFHNKDGRSMTRLTDHGLANL